MLIDLVSNDRGEQHLLILCAGTMSTLEYSRLSAACPAGSQAVGTARMVYEAHQVWSDERCHMLLISRAIGQ